MAIDPQIHAEVLIEALPYLRHFYGKTVVVKYGGNAMTEEKLKHSFASDVVMLKLVGINTVIVHGGGPQIDDQLNKIGKKGEFVQGMRVTDAETMDVVEMVLAGLINKQIVGFINNEGGRAIGLCGKDGNMVTARKVTRTIVDDATKQEQEVDLGFVGEPDHVDSRVLEALLGRELIPVLAPVCNGEDGQTYNVNADTFAGAIAGALKAKRLLLLTDVPGVLDKNKELIPELTIARIHELIADGTITGGMIPKVETCIYALEQGVEGVVIMDGKVPHAVLLELLTDHGAGTLITK